MDADWMPQKNRSFVLKGSAGPPQEPAQPVLTPKVADQGEAPKPGLTPKVADQGEAPKPPTKSKTTDAQGLKTRVQSRIRNFTETQTELFTWQARAEVS